MRKKLTAVSLFSGCGGFDIGAQRAGVKIIWANDSDPYAASGYQSLLPDVPFTLGDVRKIKAFPKADILIGCYPCTGFSEAARRRPKDFSKRDLRANPGNYLYREFLRALRQVKPKFLFVENVKGMLTAEDGWFFERQLDGFRRHGFRVQFKLLNAAHYGVAQERRRIFIVGVREDVTNFEYEFPEPTHGPSAGTPFVVLRDAIGNLAAKTDDEYCRRQFHGHYLTRNRKRGWDEPSYTVVAHASHVPLHPDGRPMKGVGKDQYVLQGRMNRRLSWRECAAIQGLPRRISVDGGLSAKYRVVGNAVPPPLGKSLLTPVVKGWGGRGNSLVGRSKALLIRPRTRSG
jgi:DNA (cytosine-5)-methyltransferase 1